MPDHIRLNVKEFIKLKFRKIKMELKTEFKNLQLGQDLITSIPYKDFAYFKFTVSDNTRILTIHADPENSNSY